MSVTYPKGFRAAGVTAGLKPSGRPDLGLLVGDPSTTAAGLFTFTVTVTDTVGAAANQVYGLNVNKASPGVTLRSSANPAVFAYIGRSLLEADAPGRELFDRLLLVARAQLDRLFTKRLLRKDLDLEWAALHLILINVGAFLLAPTLERYLGTSLLGDTGMGRMEKATTDLFLKGIYRQRTRQTPRR